MLFIVDYKARSRPDFPLDKRLSFNHHHHQKKKGHLEFQILSIYIYIYQDLYYTYRDSTSYHALVTVYLRTPSRHSRQHNTIPLWNNRPVRKALLTILQILPTTRSPITTRLCIRRIRKACQIVKPRLAHPCRTVLRIRVHTIDVSPSTGTDARTGGGVIRAFFDAVGRVVVTAAAKIEVVEGVGAWVVD